MARKAPITLLELNVLLAISRRPRDAYPFTISEEIEYRTRRRETLGVIYAVIDRLLKRRLITSRDSDLVSRNGERGPKLLYSLSESGVEALSNALADVDRMRAA